MNMNEKDREKTFDRIKQMEEWIIESSTSRAEYNAKAAALSRNIRALEDSVAYHYNLLKRERQEVNPFD